MSAGKWQVVGINQNCRSLYSGIHVDYVYSISLLYRLCMIACMCCNVHCMTQSWYEKAQTRGYRFWFVIVSWKKHLARSSSFRLTLWHNFGIHVWKCWKKNLTNVLTWYIMKFANQFHGLNAACHRMEMRSRVATCEIKGIHYCAR